MERVPQEEIDLQKYWFVLKRRWLPASMVFVSVITVAILYGLTRKPSYEAKAQLLFQSNRTPSLTDILREGQGNRGELGRLEALGREDNPLNTQAEIVKSVPIVQETITALNLMEDGKPLEPEALIRNLTVKAIPGTDILQLSYQNEDPQQSAAVVNKIIDVFIRSNVQSNRAEPRAAREFIETQLPKTELAVREADRALREFKEDNNVLVLQEESIAAVRSIAALNDQISQTKAQLADVTAQSEQLQSQIRSNPQQALLYSKLSQSLGVQDVLNQLQQAQRELTVQQTRFRSGPPITKLEEKITALNELLKQRVEQITGSQQQIPVDNLQIGDTEKQLVVKLIEVDTQREGLVNRLSILSNTYVLYKERARAIPSLEETQRELERKLSAAQTTYEALLTRLQAIQVTENQNIGNARIVTKALIPKKPLDSKKKLIYGAGAVAGFLLGIATAFLLDILDQSVKTIKEGREQLGYTLLSVIPIFEKTGEHSKSLLNSESTPPRVIIRDIPNSIAIEAYQMLQANLRFLSSDRELKSVVVTSAVPGEGKSEVAANLAVAIAQVGRRVLLVDADMRHSSMHAVWDLPNAPGLSHILVGQSEVDEAIQEVIPNLDVLTSGVVPPNPVALLDSNRMATLIVELYNSYDFIIFDTPPVIGFADASSLGRMVDGIVFVMRPGILTFSAANAAKEVLSRTGQKVLGMVINGVNPHNEPDSYFHYAQNYAASTNLNYVAEDGDQRTISTKI